ncbi:MAG TPA: DUF1028 domain-containing protein [Acidobacteriota bacterium]|nr:DUF1028 domain-containing protein [Acidobacteriota bacterium]
MKRFIAFAAFLLVALPLFAEIPVHTFSIVARDPQTGEIGVAVQSHYFSVGGVVPWAEAGVGAVATQSFVEVSYGPLGLELMKAGKTAPEALDSLLASDAARDTRQVAMIDAAGNVKAWTGKKCITAAGDHTGVNYSAQANLMANDRVWPAMANAFEHSTGMLAERMLAALDAAQAAGGDIRGEQSAAILVVSGTKTGVWWKDRLVDLRVEDNPHPIAELRRLLKIQQAYKHEDRGDEFVAQKKMPEALKEYETAAQLDPDNNELLFWYAVGAYTGGNESKALEIFAKVFARDQRWIELVDRLPASDLLPADAVPKIKAAASKPAH